MRLTKFDKEAFVSSVLDDVPMVDYDELSSEVARKAFIDAMPRTVRAVYDYNREWLETGYTYLPGRLSNIHCIRPPEAGQSALEKNHPDVWARLVEMNILAEAQADSRRKLKSKLEGAIGGCNTLKAALDRLPEFAKYLPQERDGFSTLNLPAVANLVTDLMQAGWPKTQGV